MFPLLSSSPHRAGSFRHAARQRGLRSQSAQQTYSFLSAQRNREQRRGVFFSGIAHFLLRLAAVGRSSAHVQIIRQPAHHNIRVSDREVSAFGSKSCVRAGKLGALEIIS